MKQTEHYSLDQPAKTDYADVTILNGNMDKLDAALAELEHDKAEAVHTHAIGDVADLEAALSNKANVSQEITVAGDLYGYTTPGSYYCAWNSVAAQMQHMPPGLDTAFDLTVEMGAEGTPVQTFKSAFDKYVYVNYKSYYDPVRGWVSDWTGWIKQATSADVFMDRKETITGSVLTAARTKSPGTYLVSAEAADTPVAGAWYYAKIYDVLSGHRTIELDASATLGYKGIYTNTYNQNDAAWRGWEGPYATTADLAGMTQLPDVIGGTIAEAIAGHIANGIKHGNFSAINCTDIPDGSTNWSFNIQFYEGQDVVVIAKRSYSESVWFRELDTNGWEQGRTWAEIATATPPQELALPLAAGWENVLCSYCKTQDGMVTVHVCAKKSGPIGIGTHTIATLPPGYRPPEERKVCASNATSTSVLTTCSRITFNESGAIILQQPDPNAENIAASDTFCAAQ